AVPSRPCQGLHKLRGHAAKALTEIGKGRRFAAYHLDPALEGIDKAGPNPQKIMRRTGLVDRVEGRVVESEEVDGSFPRQDDPVLWMVEKMRQVSQGIEARRLSGRVQGDHPGWSVGGELRRDGHWSVGRKGKAVRHGSPSLGKAASLELYVKPPPCGTRSRFLFSLVVRPRRRFPGMDAGRAASSYAGRACKEGWRASVGDVGTA